MKLNLIHTGDLHCSRNGTFKLLFQFRLSQGGIWIEYSTMNFRLFKKHDGTAIGLFLATTRMRKIQDTFFLKTKYVAWVKLDSGCAKQVAYEDQCCYSFVFDFGE